MVGRHWQRRHSVVGLLRFWVWDQPVKFPKEEEALLVLCNDADGIPEVLNTTSMKGCDSRG